MIPPQQLREPVAMYMAALPCPPLPLIVTRHGKESYANSHDLIASLLVGAMSMNDDGLNAQRKSKQVELIDRLLQNIRAAGGNLDRAYSAFSEFTAGYICAFINIDVSVSFMPLDRVERNDSVHSVCCSWHRAQEVILLRSRSRGTPSEAQIQALLRQDVSHLSYAELIGLHCKRFLD
jgi:hypothetical protein